MSTEPSTGAQPGTDLLNAYRRLGILAFPILGAMASQTAFNLIDTAMVGRLGATALAGVGIGGFMSFLAATVVLGFSSGVQATVARRLGEGRDSVAARPLNAALLMIAVLYVPTIILLYLIVPIVFPILAGSTEISAQGAPYALARMTGMIFLGWNFAFRAYWNATERPGYYFKTLLVVHALNIFLNWVLIFGNLGAPELGTLGAGIGTAVALGVGSALHFWLGRRHATQHDFLGARPQREVFVRLGKLAIPAAAQEALFAGGFLAFFTILARIGTIELAAGQVLVNLILAWILPAVACGMAGATLVGQTLGNDTVDEARKWGWRASAMAAAVVTVLALPAVIAPSWFVAALTTDPDIIAEASPILRLIAASMPFEATGMVLLQVHFGAGAARRVIAIAPPLQWFVFLPVVTLLVYLGTTGFIVWLCFAGYRAIQTVIFTWSWAGKGWAGIRV